MVTLWHKGLSECFMWTTNGIDKIKTHVKSTGLISISGDINITLLTWWLLAADSLTYVCIPHFENHWFSFCWVFLGFFGVVILSESISSDIFKSIWNKGILRANLLSYDHFCVARYKLKSRSFTIYLFGRHGKETGCAIYISKCKSNLISLPPSI